MRGFRVTGDRGQSEVIGVVLLLAITVIGATTVVAVGSSVLADSRQSAEINGAEHAMTQLDSQASLVALGESDGQRFSLGDTGDGMVAVKPEGGNITLYREYEGNRTEILPKTPLGAVVYKNGGDEIAYQGGGVWKKQETGSIMLSPPEYHYQQRTLTFPIVRVTGEGAASGLTTGHIHKPTESKALFPDGDVEGMTNPLEQGSVYVKIQSEYYQAWHTFFEDRSEGDVELYDSNQTVAVNLTAPTIETIESAVAVKEEGGIDVHGNSDPPEEWEEGVNYPSASNTIDTKIKECEDGGCEAFNSTEFTGDNTYYANESIAPGGIEFDTTDGDIDVVVDGDFDVGNDNITVTGDNTVNLYINGKFSLDGNGVVNSDGSAEQFFVYIHSDIDESGAGSGTPSFTGVIYAPNTPIEMSGNADFEGAIISEELTINGKPASDSFRYDDDLTGTLIDVSGAPDEIRYLHVTENTIEIELS